MTGAKAPHHQNTTGTAHVAAATPSSLHDRAKQLEAIRRTSPRRRPELTRLPVEKQLPRQLRDKTAPSFGAASSEARFRIRHTGATQRQAGVGCDLTAAAPSGTRPALDSYGASEAALRKPCGHVLLACHDLTSLDPTCETPSTFSARTCTQAGMHVHTHMHMRVRMHTHSHMHATTQTWTMPISPTSSSQWDRSMFRRRGLATRPCRQTPLLRSRNVLLALSLPRRESPFGKVRTKLPKNQLIRGFQIQVL